MKKKFLAQVEMIKKFFPLKSTHSGKRIIVRKSFLTRAKKKFLKQAGIIKKFFRAFISPRNCPGLDHCFE